MVVSCIQPSPMGFALAEAASIDAQTVAAVLSEVAEIVSETIELREVFPRVATAVRRVLPFDNMGVVRIVDGDRVVLHATTLEKDDPDEKCSGPMLLTAWSPRWRPRLGPNIRIDDAKLELDPSYPMDATVLEGGLGSGLWEPFRRGDSFVGGVWLCAYATHAFNDEHQEVLRPIAALLGSAVEHWRIWDKEQRRQDRLDRIEALLGTLAESLDVREVFQRLSDGMQPILPHDLMVLTELDLRARTIRVAASTGECDIPIPAGGVRLTEGELERRVEFEIIRDIPAEIAPDTERQRLIVSSGLRSWLRVPVRESGEVSGGLSFFHREPSRYDQEDAEVAHRLAATVETLARELESRGRGRMVGLSRSWKEVLRAVGRVASSVKTVLITG